MAELVLYLDVDAEDAAVGFARDAAGLPDVTDVETEVEETERSLSAGLVSLTVTITAAAGTVEAVSLLLGRLTELLGKVLGLRQAWVQTTEGPRPLEPPASGPDGQGPR